MIHIIGVKVLAKTVFFYKGAAKNPLYLPLPGSCKLVIIEKYSILTASLGTKA